MAERSEYGTVLRNYDDRHLRRTELVVEAALNTTIGQRRLALDLGVGTALFWSLFRACENGPDVVGIDSDAHMLRAARHRGVSKLALVMGDFQSALPFKDRSFDAAVAMFSIRHCLDPGTVLAEVRRILMPRGMFLLVDFTDGVLAAGADILLKCYSVMSTTTFLTESAPAYCPYPLRELLRSAEQSAFTLRDLAYVNDRPTNPEESLVEYLLESPPLVYEMSHLGPEQVSAIRERLDATWSDSTAFPIPSLAVATLLLDDG